VHQKDIPEKPPDKVKGTREEMHKTLENKKKVTANSPRSDFKRKNKVEDRGASGLGMKREQKSQGVKREHHIQILEGEEHLHFEGDVCEDCMETTTSLKHLQHLQQHLQQQQQQ
jgi:hypothetical protein